MRDLLIILLYGCSTVSFFFFFNDTATTEIYTLSLHDALPILNGAVTLVEEGVINFKLLVKGEGGGLRVGTFSEFALFYEDRKSTRLNSSHLVISYAVFCLKKKSCISRHLYCHHLLK